MIELAEIKKAVTESLVENLGVDATEVTPDALLVDDLGADSLDGIELLIDLEEKYNLDIPEEDSTKFLTVQNVIDYVYVKLGGVQ